MRRRKFIAALSTFALPSCLAEAQVVGRTYRLGIIGPGPVHNFNVGFPPLVDELRKAGFVEGKNLAIEVRHISENPSTTFEDAKAIASGGVDAFITLSQEFTVRAALAASETAPVIAQATHFDIVAKGFAKSLARPGGRVTGLHLLMDHLAEKQLEILAEIRPSQTVLGVLYDRFTADQMAIAERLGKERGLTIVGYRFNERPYGWEAGFDYLRTRSAQKLLVLSSPFFTPYARDIAQRAIQAGLPSMFTFPLYVDAGGLMSYAVDIVAIYRRVGQYASRVLAGMSPGELPIEQPRAFQLKLNLQTARALDLELPPSVLVRADGVIE